MFERPDADYLQDLLAGYVLGTLDRVERHYLEEQMARDPKLQQVLYQLEHALEAVEQPRRGPHVSREHTAPATPAVPRLVHTRPPERRWAKWIIVLSALAAVSAVSISLPWLRQRYQIREFVSSWIPGQSEGQADLTLTAWQSLEFLLEDHSRVRQAAQTDLADTQLDGSDLDEAYATLEQVFAEAGGLQALSGEDVHLLRGSYYEQPHFHGLRLTYRLGPQNPATADTVMTVYQLQSQSDEELWVPGHIMIESPNGTNLLVWRSQSTVYAIAAQLPFSTLRSHAASLSPL
ncbi:MAG: hypothetical protein AAFU71_10940 [Cyanobacteria bacterium J06632_22]